MPELRPALLFARGSCRGSREKPPLLDALSGLCFAGFVLAALAVLAAQRRRRGPHERRTAVNALILYTLTATIAAGITQRDLWPFSNWKLAAGRVAPHVTRMRVVAVDEAGVEHKVDYRAWQPLAFDELIPWLELIFPRLDAPAQKRVARHLLERAERARQRARKGRSPGYFDRFLGPLAAPYFVLHPKRWTDPAATPPRPLARLRLYNETWNLEERRRDEKKLVRVLAYEYPRP